ncbi:MAG: group III truncated hemoglobin [Brevundimonas sp.]
MASARSTGYQTGMESRFRIEDPAGAAARREAAVQQLRDETGIDEVMIDALVEGFYARVRNDALIGPIFAARIDDWGPHLAQMKLFWSSIALSTGVYQGRPMPKHLPLPIDARHFDRWLEIFAETARDLCPPVAAAHFIERARRIAASFELGVASASGVILGKDERFIRPTQAWAPE